MRRPVIGDLDEVHARDVSSVALEPERPGWEQIGTTGIWGRPLGEMAVGVRWRLDGRAWHEQTLQVVRGRAGLAERWWLVCPVRGTRHRTLYVLGAQLASRAALNASYLSQLYPKRERLELRRDRLMRTIEGTDRRGPARGANRKLLIAELQTIVRRLAALGSWELHVDAFLASEEDRERRRKPKRRRVRASDPPLSTLIALRAGRRMERRPSSAAILTDLRRRSWAGTSDVGDVLHQAVTRSSNHAELDVRLLRPRRGVAKAHRLLWRFEDERELIAHIGYVDSGSGEERLRVLWRSGAVEGLQTLKVQRGYRAGDMFVACPVTGRRCVKLYFRERRFASRQAQRLVH